LLLRRLLLFFLLALLTIAAADGNGSRPLYHDKVAVLVYHHVDNQDTSSVTITTGLLDRQLRNLLKRGYHFITMEEFRAFMAGGPVKDNALLVTFDDGYKSFYTNAVPVLTKNGVQAVNFIITEFVDQPDKSYVPSMNVEEMSELTAAGAAELQCHSNQLHQLVNPKESYLSGKLTVSGVPETDDQYRTRIKSDTRACANQLRRFHSTADAYAYPFGMFNEEVPGLLQEEGIRYAFTTKSGIADRKTELMEIPRVNAGSPFMTPRRVHKAIMREL
jgi:poly-beta-1,6-N-acetyl-D-glucosamine N-deacetylase